VQNEGIRIKDERSSEIIPHPTLGHRLTVPNQSVQVGWVGSQDARLKGQPLLRNRCLWYSPHLAVRDDKFPNMACNIGVLEEAL
jgi:hypothetical protein